MNISTKRQFRVFRHATKNPKAFLLAFKFWRLLVLIGVIIVIVWSLVGPYFRIKTITCVNQDNQTCDELVMAELQRHVGKSTFLISVKPIKAKLESANPAYQNVEVITKLPNMLVVSMIDKDEYTHLKVASHSAVLVVDKNLLVVNKSADPTPGLFTVVASDAATLGVGDSITDNTLKQAFSLGNQLREHYISFQNIAVVSPVEIRVTLENGIKVLFTSSQDITRQVTTLQLILSKATITKEPTVIDVRFLKPVLKYE